MIATTTYRDTPSIIGNTIDSFRSGRVLRYSQLTATEKCDYLFDCGIRATAYNTFQNGGLPDVVGGLLQFGRSSLKSIADHLLSQTLTRIGDEFEEPKPKLFHTYGSTAKIVFRPEATTTYTGIFANEAHGLARFSYAGPVMGVGAVPGLAIKFPIDGDCPSENLIVMRKLDRQQPLWRYFSIGSYNSVFQNPFTNILPAPWFFNLVMRTVRKRFETVVDKGRGLQLPLDNIASVRPDGTRIPAERMFAPHRVIFCPSKIARNGSNPKIDFRVDLAENIPKGTLIYEVLALSPTEEEVLRRKGLTTVEQLIPEAQKIGTITTESEFIASKYGDYRLFFKHPDNFLRQKYRLS